MLIDRSKGVVGYLLSSPAILGYLVFDVFEDEDMPGISQKTDSDIDKERECLIKEFIDKVK